MDMPIIWIQMLQWDVIDNDPMIPHLIWIEKVSLHSFDEQCLMKDQEVCEHGVWTIISHCQSDNWDVIQLHLGLCKTINTYPSPSVLQDSTNISKCTSVCMGIGLGSAMLMLIGWVSRVK